MKEIEAFKLAEEERAAKEAEARKVETVEAIISKEILFNTIDEDKKDARVEELTAWDEPRLTGFSEALAALPVEVTALQYAFLFHYPKGDIISGELHVPKGQLVSLRLEAKDVIHAFWVPEFRIKQDVIPGQPTILSFTATKPGRYPIVCAELCGPYHGSMRSAVVVEEPTDYDTWFSNNAKTTVPEA